MIGTIIIAIVGYGFSIFCAFIGVFGMWSAFKGDMEADRAFFGALLFFLMASGLAFGTRLLAGGW